MYSLLPFDFKPDFTACTASDLSKSHATWLLENGLTGSTFAVDVDTNNIDKMIMLSFQNIVLDYDSTMSSLIGIKN